MDKSGIAIGESVIIENFEVTLRGVVGAGSELKILIDIEDLNGNPLTLFNDDGTVSENPLDFRSIKLRSKETLNEEPLFPICDSLNYDVILSPVPYDENAMGWVQYPQNDLRSDIIDNNNGKATVLMSVSLDSDSIEDFMGETLYLTLNDIVQYVLADGMDLKVNLYGLVNQFNNVTSKDFVQNGGSTKDFINWEKQYELITDTDKEVMLSEKNADYTVTNAAVWNGTFYLRGNLPYYDEEVSYSNLSAFSLYNVKTGEWLRGGGGYGNGDEDHVARWNCSINGINSVEELKDYILVFGHDLEKRALAEGQWDFEIPITFENLATTHPINQKFTLGEFELTANDITVSPYYISLNVSADKENLEKMTFIKYPFASEISPIETGLSAWDAFIWEQELSVTVIMKNGSEVVIPIISSGFYEKDNEFKLTPDVVIDPTYIEYIKIGDLTFQLS